MAAADLTESGDDRIIQIKGMGAARTQRHPRLYGFCRLAGQPGGHHCPRGDLT